MIFSEENYFLLNEIENYHLFNWANTNHSVQVKIAFSIHNEKAISIPKAPYSGFVCQGKLTKLETHQFMKDLVDYCAHHGASKITIKQSPFFLNTENHELLTQSAIQKGFQVTEESNHHIVVSDFDKSKIHPMQKRRIKKCLQEALTFEKTTNPNIEEYYNFFVRCRSQQGEVLNINKNHLKQLLTSNLAKYELFSIFTSERKVIAALVLLTVDDSTCYYFIPAFDRDYSHLSPLSFLLTELIELLKTRQIKYLDLGTSNKDAVSLDSLIKYKERMGGIASKRLVYSI